MNLREQFYQMIREYPDEDPPRLIFADWLEEQGDPRSEFIRIQCELAHLSPVETARRDRLEKREQALLKCHRPDWTRGLAGFQVRSARFQRGFLEAADLSYRPDPGDDARRFSRLWANLIEEEPGLVQVRLFLRDWSGIRQLASAPQLRALHFNHQGLERREVSQLIRWPIVRGLSALDLSHNNLRTGVESVANCPDLENLRELDLSFNRIGNRGAKALLASPYLRQLERLHLRGNHIGRHGKEKLRMAFGSRVQL